MIVYNRAEWVTSETRQREMKVRCEDSYECERRLGNDVEENR